MFYKASLYIALLIFGFGLFYKVSAWFRYTLVNEGRAFTISERISAALKGVVSTLFSRKILILLKTFVLDVFLQVRTLKESLPRWLMHILIYYGFLGLLLIHALESIVSEPLFPAYNSTLNPFMFLRDLFGAMVIAGVALAMYRRFILKLPRLRTSTMDHYAIFILMLIMLSGILLEGVKISSYKAFKAMQEEYAALDSEEEIRALESFWVQNFAVVSPNVKGPFEQDVILRGKEIHEMNCAGCHSPPKWAFAGYTAAKATELLAIKMDRANFSEFLWYIHFLACFIGLAYLPFSKMFHIVVSPLSLLANSVMEKERSDPANIATRQVMELDACTHCGACSLRCAVGMAFEEIPNVNVLPSEKIHSLKAIAAGRALNRQQTRLIQEGLYLCTNCHRCTDVCPVGINLQDLWFGVREAILKKGYPELFILSPLSLHRGLMSKGMGEDQYKVPVQLAKERIAEVFKVDIQDNTLTPAHRDDRLKIQLRISAQSETFSHCYNCKTCTTACPVMHNFDKPQEALGLVPHQIMQATALGLGDLVFSSKMLWACLGCYRCQEQCPQGVRVADVFYELKNLAVQRVKGRAPDL